MKSKVIMLIGPPLSGKDTYINKNDFSQYVIISRDDILMSLHENNNYEEAFKNVNQKEVDRILNRNIQTEISQRSNVIINMTNLTKKSRNKHLCKFPSNIYKKIAIVFPKLDIMEYGERNTNRQIKENKSIPLSVMISMIQSWEEVDIDEGFDEIIKL